MSGIVGIFNREENRSIRPLLERMTRAVAHRGPDGIRFWIDGPVGFAHLMLHTTPESLHEKQHIGMMMATSAWSLTADDNRRNWQDHLGREAFVFATTPTLSLSCAHTNVGVMAVRPDSSAILLSHCGIVRGVGFSAPGDHLGVKPSIIICRTSSLRSIRNPRRSGACRDREGIE